MKANGKLVEWASFSVRRKSRVLHDQVVGIEATARRFAFLSVVDAILDDQATRHGQRATNRHACLHGPGRTTGRFMLEANSVLRTDAKPD